MATEVFVGDVDGKATRYGNYVFAGGSGIKPGLLVKFTSGSSVELAGTTDAPWGVAYGARHGEYRPTSKTFSSGEELVVLMGDFMCYYSADFFHGGTLPAAGATLYSYTGGLMHTSGTNKVGRCITTFSRIEEVGGVGTSQPLALVQFELKP